mgnify:CR=1 FL=1|jgi:hypothetical protein
MLPYSDIASFFAGIFLGLLYGLSFVVQKKRALLFFKKNISNRAVFIKSFGFFALRIILLALILYYLLLSAWINFIMLALGFMVSFWTIILIKKASFYETN